MSNPAPAPPTKQVIVATFPAANDAAQVESVLEDLARHLRPHSLDRIAVLEKHPNGTVEIHEAHDARAALTRIAASVTGAAAWLVYGLFGFSGPNAGEIAFDTTEEMMKRVIRDMGFDDTELQLLGNELDAGSSALILVVPTGDTTPIVETLLRLGGTVVERPLTPEAAAELEPQLPPSGAARPRGG